MEICEKACPHCGDTREKEKMAEKEMWCDKAEYFKCPTCGSVFPVLDGIVCYMCHHCY